MVLLQSKYNVADVTQEFCMVCTKHFIHNLVLSQILSWRGTTARVWFLTPWRSKWQWRRSLRLRWWYRLWQCKCWMSYCCKLEMITVQSAGNICAIVRVLKGFLEYSLFLSFSSLLCISTQPICCIGFIFLQSTSTRFVEDLYCQHMPKGEAAGTTTRYLFTFCLGLASFGNSL